MKKLMLANLAAVLILVGCPQSNWETDVYSTLASAKATIDCASAGYNHNDAQIAQDCAGVTTPASMYLPQTAQVHDVLQKAGQAKDAAVNAMLTYEAAKGAKNATDQATLQANVNTAVAALSADIAEITTLIKGGSK